MLVVSLTTVTPDPEERVEVTGTTKAAVVEFPTVADVGTAVDVMFVGKEASELAVTPLVIDELAGTTLLDIFRGLDTGGDESGMPVAAADNVPLLETREALGVNTGGSYEGDPAEITLRDDAVMELTELVGTVGVKPARGRLDVALAAATMELLLEEAGSVAVVRVLVKVIVVGLVKWSVVVISLMLVDVVWLPVPQ